MGLSSLVLLTGLLIVFVTVWATIVWLMRLKEHERKAEELRNKVLMDLLRLEKSRKADDPSQGQS